MKKRVVIFIMAVCLIASVSALTACNGEKDYASCALNGTWLEGIDSVEFTDGDGGVYGVIDKRNFRIPDLPKDLLVIRINLSGEDSVKNLQFYIDGSEYALSELKYIEGTSLPYYEITYRVTDDFVISFVGTTSSNEGELTVEVWPEEFVQGDTITVQEGTVDEFNIMVRLSSGHYADITQVVSLVSDNPDVIEVMPDPYDMSENFAAYSAFVRSVGTAHVTISTSKQTKTLTFVVTELPPAQVSKLELNRSTMQLYNGWQNYDTYVTAKLDCSEFDAQRTVKVSVDNPSVISLGETSFSNNYDNDGESTGSTAYISVTPAKVGSAKISITALGLTATCDVNVVAKPDEVEGSQGLQIEKQYISGYGVGDGVYCVTGLGTCTDSEIVIPNVYNGERVIGVGALYSSVELYDAQMGESPKLNNVQSITVPEGVEVLNAGAFQYLMKLQSVTLPSGLRQIGRDAFYQCFELTELELPDTVETIDSQAFYGAGITSITIPGSVQSITSGAFYMSSLASVTLNEGVKTIGEGAFRSCVDLTEVKLPKSLIEIGNLAFCECKKLSEIELPNGLKTIGNGVFSNCESLSEIELPESVESLGESVLSYTAITEFEWHTKVTEIPKNFFAYCNRLASVTISEGVTKIGEGAFSYCIALNNVTLPSSVKNIEKDAFASCTHAFNEIHLSSGVTYGINAFSGVEVKKIYAADLTTLASGWVIFNFDYESGYEVFLGENATVLSGAITIPAEVGVVPYEFLVGYGGITSVTIEAEEIGEYAFSYCPDLTTVVLKNTKKINNAAFYYCDDITDVTLPDDLELFGWGCFDKGYSTFNGINLHMGSWQGYFNIGEAMGENNSMEKLSGRKLYIDEELITGEVTIPSTADVIPSYAFYYDGDITEVVIENGVKEIGELAFYGCSKLQSITLPDSLTTIDPDAIGFCEELTDIECSDSLDISDLRLVDCDKIKGTPSADERYYVFGGRIRSIAEGLTYFVVPHGLKFAPDAFESVSETLKFIYAEDLSVLQDVNLDNCSELQAILGRDGQLDTNVKIIKRVNSLCTSDGWVYEKESSSTSKITLLCFIGEPDSDGNVTVPTTVDNVSVANLSFLDSRDGNGCFFGNDKIKKITFTNREIIVTSVSFLDLTNLEEIALTGDRWIVMPGNDTAQVSSTFETCTQLKNISVPENYSFSVSYQNKPQEAPTPLTGGNTILEILKKAPRSYLFIVELDAPGMTIDTVVGHKFVFKTARAGVGMSGVDSIIEMYQGTTLNFNSDSHNGTITGGKLTSQAGGTINFTYTYNNGTEKTGNITLQAGEQAQGQTMTMTFKVDNDKLILDYNVGTGTSYNVSIELVYVLQQ